MMQAIVAGGNEALRILAEASAPVVADAMSKCLCPSVRNQTMDAGIRPLHPASRLCGPAYTVKCYPGATYAVEQALAQAPPGYVLVCDGQGSEAGVLMGGLMSRYAQSRGLIGAVVDGAVRDVNEILEIGFSVFSRHITACSGTYDRQGEWGGTISCGSVVVHCGDVVVADVNGVVIVPSGIVADVARAASALLAWENAVKARLCRGESLQEATSAVPAPAAANSSGAEMTRLRS